MLQRALRFRGHCLGHPLHQTLPLRAFASETKRIDHPKEIQAKSKVYPIYNVSEFGDLVSISPVSRSRQFKTGKPDLREVKLIDNNTDARVLYRMLTSNESTYYMFNPERAHFTNAKQIYASLKKRVKARYYGNFTKTKREKLMKEYANPVSGLHSRFHPQGPVDPEAELFDDLSADMQEIHEKEQAEIHKRIMKGSSFGHCDLPIDIFNYNRTVKTKIRQILGRVGFLMLRDGTLEAKGDRIPDLTTPEVQAILHDQEQALLLPQFEKPDYFACMPFVEGLISAEEFKRKGMQINCLRSRMLYPMHGVYMPTQQTYLNLFSNYVSQMSEVYSKAKNLVDFGVGSGILSIILKENGGYKGTITGLDKNENSLEAAKVNLMLYGLMTSEFNLQNADLVDLYYPKQADQRETAEKSKKKTEFYERVAKGLGIPEQLDLIVSNPPWLPASHLSSVGNYSMVFDTDNAIYDPNEQFLISSFNFAKYHLAPDGHMLLVYSDMAQQIGLQEPKRVEDLGAKMGFSNVELLDSTYLPQTRNLQDPLKLVKRKSKVQLYRVAW